MKTIKIEIGDEVICDACCEDYTDSNMSGGLIFGSWAICPKCEPKWRKRNLVRPIKGVCTPGMSFANWIRTVRSTAKLAQRGK